MGLGGRKTESMETEYSGQRDNICKGLKREPASVMLTRTEKKSSSGSQGGWGSKRLRSGDSHKPGNEFTLYPRGKDFKQHAFLWLINLNLLL